VGAVIPSEAQRLADPASERERIEVATFELVLERGYVETTVEAVCERTGLSAETFARHFADLQSCVGAIYGEINDAFDCQVQAAYDAQAHWRTSLRAAAYAAADFFASHPREARFCTVAIMDAGELIAVRRDANLQRFVDLIDAGRSELPDPSAIGREAAESAIGAIFERLLRNVSRDAGGTGIRRAGDFVPELMYLAVRPYVGHAEALKELSMPPPSAQSPSSRQENLNETTCATSGAMELGFVAVNRDPSPEEEGAARLARLPPGRHGLSREFVAQNQRDRLVAGTIAAIAEKGYRDATVTDVVAAAGVSRRTFYHYFSSKQDCYMAAYDVVARHLAEASTTAAEGVADWGPRVKAEIAGAMAFFAANPDLVRFYLQAPPRAGEDVATRHRQATGRVLAQLSDGAPAATRKPNPDVLNAVAGGMAALIVRKVEEGQGENLSELVADLTELFLAPFLGREQAADIARGA
jgi:AcrR family transcriptional regulator